MTAPPTPAGDWPTGFMLLQGNRLERLRELLALWMHRHPLRPLEDEVILVQSNGIGQWLKLALAQEPAAGGCGIAAALDVTLPARFIWQTYGQLLGELPSLSAYHKAPLGWRLYRLLGDLDALAAHNTAHADRHDALAPLREFLATDHDVRRRHQLATRLADLFDQYQVYRSDWLAAWEQGEEVVIRPDGTRHAVPAEQRWQPLLWRALSSEVALTAHPPTGQSRAQIHRHFLARARALAPEERPANLPRRVIVFGISSLPRQTLEVLEAIGHLSQVMLFVHNPSRHYWGDIIEGRELFRRAYRRQSARKVPEDLPPEALHLHGHPLLAAWGKQGRDYIRLLDEHDQRETYEARFEEQNLAIDLFESPGSDSLLQQLQDDILELRPLSERRALASTIDPRRDHSLRFLVAHGPQREVEILHDQLLEAFAQAQADAAALPPRDILVMVPDIDTYAPHIEAVFGRLTADDPRYIPFHITDQGQRHRNPVLIGLERLLNLPQARFSVSELLDLLDIAALRGRFGIQEADLPRLRQWIQGAQIRWGLDAAQRQALGMPEGLTRNTWSFGLERMLLGFAGDDAGPWHGIEPYAEVGGLEAHLVGPLEQLLESLADAWHTLQRERTPEAWSHTLLTLVETCFVELDEADTRAMNRIREALEQWLSDCQAGGALHQPLPLEVVRETLLEAVDEPTLSQHFLAGSVNFATLMPMRAVPFRQIWLLGMNDGDYPRSRRPADFDLMAQDYRPGDRSRREDDRYLFLEAVLSARERLVISWVGRSIRDNSHRPPSVLVAQLRDHLAAGWRLDGSAHGDGDAAELLTALTTEHPLQPFSRDYFHPERPARLFTYAHEWQALESSEPATAERPPVLPAPTFDDPLHLTTLGRFLRHPAAHFYAQRLGLGAADESEPIVDEEVFHLHGLTLWQIHQQSLEHLATALHRQPQQTTAQLLAEALDQLGRAGHLPLPPLDTITKETLFTTLSTPVATFRQLQQAHPRRCPPQEVDISAAAVRLVDRITDRLEAPDGARLRLCLSPSRIQKKQGLQWHHLVRHWPTHLAAQLDGPLTTHLLGPDSHITLPPLDAATAQAQLEGLLAGYATGVTELLPLACRTAFTHLADADHGTSNKAQETYEGGYQRSGEREEHPAYPRFWPHFAELIADGRFAAQAERLYGPLYRQLTPAQVDG